MEAASKSAPKIAKLINLRKTKPSPFFGPESVLFGSTNLKAFIKLKSGNFFPCEAIYLEMKMFQFSIGLNENENRFSTNQKARCV